MATSPTGLGPKNDCAGEGRQQFKTADPSSRQRERTTSTNPQLTDSNKNVVLNPRWVLYSKIDWPTDRRSRLRLSHSKTRSRHRNDLQEGVKFVIVN
jgi:hypothetical protein